MRTPAGGPIGGLTDPAYWDSFWAHSSVPMLRDDDSQYGSQGYFLKVMRRELGPLSGKSVIELGGAMSYRLITLSRFAQMRATAIDYAPDAIEASKRFYIAHGVNIELACADFFSTVFDGRQFDVVSHWGVVEHFEDPFPIIQRSVDLCSDNGRVIFGLPQMVGPGALFWRKLSPDNWKRHIYHSDALIAESFGRIGWKCKRFFFGSPLIHMNPCESDGPVPAALSFAQRIVDRLGTLGAPYQYGVPYISSNRGFVAWKDRLIASPRSS